MILTKFTFRVACFLVILACTSLQAEAGPNWDVIHQERIDSHACTQRNLGEAKLSKLQNVKNTQLTGKHYYHSVMRFAGLYSSRQPVHTDAKS